MAHLFAFYATWHHVSVGALCTYYLQRYRYMGPSSQPPNTTWCPHHQDIEYILIYTYQWTVQNKQQLLQVPVTQHSSATAACQIWGEI